MTAILRPLVDILFPASAVRLAARSGLICIVLAVLVALLFPAAARAGTETTTARWVTAGALLVGGLALRLSAGNLAVAAGGVAVLVAGSFAAPAAWLLVLGGMACLYVATALLPRARHVLPEVDRDPQLGAAQELIESLATALVLALVVREFGFEAFKIPTGSMEPTILGDRQDRQGDRLLAFKPIEYRRWDIVVFKFPLFRNTNYIKRMIGLPGEHLELRSGDVYANGVIAPKPDDVQEVMWRRVFATRPDSEWSREFDLDAQGAWKLRSGFAEASAKGGDIAWLQARSGFQEDQRVSFDAEVPPGQAGGELLVSLEGGGRRCELTVAAGGARVSVPSAETAAEGEPHTKAIPVPGLSLADFAKGARLGFSVSDRIARVYLDGRQIASFAHADVTNDGLEQGKVRIGARDLAATVRDVVGENDVQYTRTGDQEWDIPDDAYIMLGDNTGSSRDSRLWTANVVRTKDGREFVAPTTARVTEEREETVFRMRPDGGVDFIDSYAIPRSFAASEIEEIRREVHEPFARRADLVGRAFVIFFPFRSAGEFRPRLLR
jgi:signal peptidase I